MGRKKGGDGGAKAIQAGQVQAVQALQKGKNEGYNFLNQAEQKGLEGVNLITPQSRRIMQQSFGNLENFDELANEKADSYDAAYLAPSQRAVNETLKNLFRSGGAGGSNNSRLQNYMARSGEEIAFNEAQRRIQLQNQARQDFLQENQNLYNIGSQPEMYRSGQVLDLGKSRANTAIGVGSQMGQTFQQGGQQLAQAQQASQARRDSKNSGMATLGAGIVGQGIRMFSDERLKENLEPVGALDNGLTVYVGNYKGTPTPQLFLVAQEVQTLRPDAVTKDKASGYLKVDYTKAVA